MIVGLILLLPVVGMCSSHGHIGEPLDVVVRLVSPDSSSSVAGIALATVSFRSCLETEDDFRKDLEGALNLREEPEASIRQRHSGSVYAEITDRSGIATIRSSVRVTRYWIGPIQTQKLVRVPEILVIEHPTLGRAIVPLDPDSPIEEGEEPDTWKLDLGTITLPQESEKRE